MAYTTAAEDVDRVILSRSTYHLTSTCRPMRQSDLQRGGFTLPICFPDGKPADPDLYCDVCPQWLSGAKRYETVLVHASDLWEMSGLAGLLTSESVT